MLYRDRVSLFGDKKVVKKQLFCLNTESFDIITAVQTNLGFFVHKRQRN